MSESPLSVLFICIGNSCRSPMAEGFARHLGAGILQPSSAGLFPAAIIQPETFQVMAERGIRLENRRPRNILLVDGSTVDWAVNMSGHPITGLLHGFQGREVAWPVSDPIGLALDVYRRVRDDVEERVRRLVEEARGNGRFRAR